MTIRPASHLTQWVSPWLCVGVFHEKRGPDGKPAGDTSGLPAGLDGLPRGPAVEEREART